MINLIPIPQHTGNVTVPEDFVDPRTAASVQGPFQTLTDRAELAKDRLDAVMTGPFYGDNLILPAGSPAWAAGDILASPSTLAVQSLLADSDGRVFFPLRAPFGFHAPISAGIKITGFGMRILPAATQTVRPGVMPAVQIYARNADGTLLFLDSKVDDSASDAAYIVSHTVFKTVSINLPQTSDEGYPLWARVKGESGANTVLGLRLISVFVNLGMA